MLEIRPQVISPAKPTAFPTSVKACTVNGVQNSFEYRLVQQKTENTVL